MMGMDERTGKLVRGTAWVNQAVRRGLRTRKSSRPMARWYGTDSMRQLANPITASSMLTLTSDLAHTVEETIPGARLTTVIEHENGERMRVYMLVDGQPLNLDV